VERNESADSGFRRPWNGLAPIAVARKGTFPVTVEDCVLMDLPKVVDHRGNLTYIEATRHVPFEVRRVFYIYDVPTGESRGGHAHRALHQFLICLSGSFDVEIDDGTSQRVHHLNRPWRGLYVPPLIWARESNFDPGTVCLVLTSDFYEESDNIRDYALYRSLLDECGASPLP
jgi:dTDP-4-dehydrorhamnose 3,5-epimerase-like enzyme